MEKMRRRGGECATAWTAWSVKLFVFPSSVHMTGQSRLEEPEQDSIPEVLCSLRLLSSSSIRDDDSQAYP